MHTVSGQLCSFFRAEVESANPLFASRTVNKKMVWEKGGIKSTSHLGAITLLSNTCGQELRDQGCQQGVVEALPPLLNGDPQALVDQLKLHPAGFADLLPCLQREPR